MSNQGAIGRATEIRGPQAAKHQGLRVEELRTSAISAQLSSAATTRLHSGSSSCTVCSVGMVRRK